MIMIHDQMHELHARIQLVHDYKLINVRSLHESAVVRTKVSRGISTYVK